MEIKEQKVELVEKKEVHTKSRVNFFRIGAFISIVLCLFVAWGRGPLWALIPLGVAIFLEVLEIAVTLNEMGDVE